jgi:hypothetical protein
MKSIEQVQRENEPRWMSLSGVVGVGLGETGGKPCFVILLRDSIVPPGLPVTVEGYPVITTVAGKPEALE